MKSNSKTINDYIQSIPKNRKTLFLKLWETIKNNIPEGFEERLSFGMPGFVVPESIFPDGYHCNKNEPLPFLSLANHKNYISLYHMGLYMDDKLFQWFVNEYSKISKKKLGIGKSCIRFTDERDIPFDLIEELMKKMDVHTYIKLYLKQINSRRK